MITIYDKIDVVSTDDSFQYELNIFNIIRIPDMIIILLIQFYISVNKLKNCYRVNLRDVLFYVFIKF